MYLVLEVAMSLSRFYKKNQDFQPDAILPQATPQNTEPVWGESIVVEEKEEKPEPVLQEEVKPVVENTSEGIDEVAIEEAVPPPRPPAVPDIDIDTIRNEAFASGVDQGRKEAEEDFENGVDTFLNICNELDKLRETILKNSVSEMKILVIDISEKIIRHSLTEQDETITATIKEAIQLAVKSDEIQILINPDDMKCIEEKKQEIIDSMSGLENISLQPDATIDRGGCKLESSCCTVDATLTNQLKVIRDNVMAVDHVNEQITD